jgi:hypothetical protein
MQFENLEGMTLLGDTEARAVNGGHGCDRRRRHDDRHHRCRHHDRRCGGRGQGDKSGNFQSGLVNVDITGNNDTVIIEIEG